MKNFLIALALLLISTSVLASGVKAPNALDISQESVSFDVTLENSSSLAKKLEVEFYPPSDHSLSTVPDVISPRSKLVLTVTLDHDDYLANQEYTSLLRVKMGEDYFSKQITLNYLPLAAEPPAVVQPPADNTPVQPSPGPATGLMALGFGSTTEFVIDIVLILVAAILLIGFISRLTKRFRGVY